MILFTAIIIENILTQNGFLRSEVLYKRRSRIPKRVFRISLGMSIVFNGIIKEAGFRRERSPPFTLGKVRWLIVNFPRESRLDQNSLSITLGYRSPGNSRKEKHCGPRLRTFLANSTIAFFARKSHQHQRAFDHLEYFRARLHNV